MCPLLESGSAWWPVPVATLLSKWKSWFWKRQHHTALLTESPTTRGTSGEWPCSHRQWQISFSVLLYRLIWKKRSQNNSKCIFESWIRNLVYFMCLCSCGLVRNHFFSYPITNIFWHMQIPLRCMFLMWGGKINPSNICIWRHLPATRRLLSRTSAFPTFIFTCITCFCLYLGTKLVR